MDDIPDIMLDFTTRRPVTPPPMDMLQPSSNESSSDGASLASYESPRDWPQRATDVPLADHTDETWKWVDMDFEKTPSLGIPSTISPAMLNVQGLGFGDSYSHLNMLHQDSFIGNDAIGLPDVLQTLASFPAGSQDLYDLTQQILSQPPSVPVAPHAPTDAPSPPGPSSSSASSVSTDADDLAARVLARTGVTTAIKMEYASPQMMSPAGSPPVKQSTYRLSKDLLSERPPLAKHLQSQRDTNNSDSASSDQPDVVIGASGRPKTSHTTIERRYRTNLNARITALRHAVPALRVLEPDLFPNDRIDERGFVDGVKAARKSSKASVLGKAAEYIHVLKNRENRLKREMQGLKVLLCNLVGGPAILREWEGTWQERFGGEELDEIINGSDVEDDEGTDDEDEKPRKKPKVTKAPATPRQPLSARASVEAVPLDSTGKRKRGRPKKGGPSMSPVAADAQTISPQPSQQTVVPTFLLGTFLFFSFLKTSPLHPTPHPATREHHGSVLQHTTAHNVASAQPLWAHGVALHYIHTALAIGLVLTILQPLFTAAVSRLGLGKKSVVVLPLRVLGKTEQLKDGRKHLRSLLSMRGWAWESMASLFPSSSDTDEEALNLATQLAVTDVALGEELSYMSRLSTIVGLGRRLPASPSVRDLSTLAVLAQTTSPELADSLWRQAQTATSADDACAPVMRLELSEVYSTFTAGIRDGSVKTSDKAPLDYMTEVQVLEKLQVLSRSTFARIMDSNMTDTPWDDDVMFKHNFSDEVKEMNEYVSRAAEDLDGEVSELVAHWERIWCPTYNEIEEDLFEDDESMTSLESSSLLANTRHLVKSLVLLRSILAIRSPPSKTAMSSSFTSASTLTPTQSTLPITRDPMVLKMNTLRLRQLLGSPVFRTDSAMEDARDELVDFLCTDSTR